MSGPDRQNMNDPLAKIVNSLQAEQNADSRRRDVYDSHRHRTFSVAYYMTGNELEAERILAGTFVRAFCSVYEPTGEDVDAALLDELRERSYLDTSAGVLPLAVKTADSKANLTGHNFKRTELEQAIRELSSLERLLFLFHDVEGYTSAAVSALLQIPETQIQKGLFVARIRLRQILAAQRADEAEAA